MATTSSSSTTNLVRKPKATSPAWDYFSLQADDEGRVVKSTADFPICKMCGRNYYEVLLGLMIIVIIVIAKAMIITYRNYYYCAS